MSKRKTAVVPVFMPTSIRLPAELLAFLKADAAAQRRTVTWIILEVLNQYRAFQTKVKKK